MLVSILASGVAGSEPAAALGAKVPWNLEAVKPARNGRASVTQSPGISAPDDRVRGHVSEAPNLFRAQKNQKGWTMGLKSLKSLVSRMHALFQTAEYQGLRSGFEGSAEGFWRFALFRVWTAVPRSSPP